VVAEVLALTGCVLTLLSALGVVRFSDVLERSHAVTKASTLGVVFVLLAVAVDLEHPNDVTSAILAGLLQIVTLPVGANLLNRAVYFARDIPHRVDTVDELRDGSPPLV
jgi:multicomponent Na+:H+ antiporter subunit G